MAHPRRILPLAPCPAPPWAAFALVVSLFTPAAHAGTVSLPPLVINQLTHFNYGNGLIDDGIVIPGFGYTSSGFTLAYATGDVVRVRIEPPPGKVFRITFPVSANNAVFFFNVVWFCPCNYTDYNPSQSTVTLENLHGPPPTYLGAESQAVEGLVAAADQIVLHGSIDFTALQIDITVNPGVPNVSHDFNPVSSGNYPNLAFGAGAAFPFVPPDVTVMEIVDAGVVPTARTSWGRLKALYH